VRIRRLSAGALISLLVVSLASRGGTAEPPLVADELHVQAAVRGTVRVIVRLNSPFVPEGLLASPIHGQGQRQALSAAQSTVRQHLRGVRHRVARNPGQVNRVPKYVAAETFAGRRLLRRINVVASLNTFLSRAA